MGVKVLIEIVKIRTSIGEKKKKKELLGSKENCNNLLNCFNG